MREHQHQQVTVDGVEDCIVEVANAASEVDCECAVVFGHKLSRMYVDEEASDYGYKHCHTMEDGTKQKADC